MGSSRKRIILSGYGPIRSQVLTHFEFVFSTCYERRRCFLKAACAMDAPQGRATKRTSRRFTTPPTSRKDMRWTCASRDGSQDHLRQDPAMPRCCMVSGGAEPTMVKTTTTMGVGMVLASDG